MVGQQSLFQPAAGDHPRPRGGSGFLCGRVIGHKRKALVPSPSRRRFFDGLVSSTKQLSAVVLGLGTAAGNGGAALRGGAWGPHTWPLGQDTRNAVDPFRLRKIAQALL